MVGRDCGLRTKNCELRTVKNCGRTSPRREEYQTYNGAHISPFLSGIDSPPIRKPQTAIS